MSLTTPTPSKKTRQRKIKEAMEILRALGFTSRQSNEVAGYALLALLDLKPTQALERRRSAASWNNTDHIEFVAKAYRCPNMRQILVKPSEMRQ